MHRPVVRVLVEAATAWEDDECHLSVAEDGELIRLLQEPVAALAEGDLATCAILDPLDLNPSPPHAAKDPELGTNKILFTWDFETDKEILKNQINQALHAVTNETVCQKGEKEHGLIQEISWSHQHKEKDKSWI